MDRELTERYSKELEAMPEELRAMVTMREAAAILGCTYSHACELVRTGRIPRLGRNPQMMIMARTVDVLHYRDSRIPQVTREVVAI